MPYSSPGDLQTDIDSILEGRANLVNADGEDIFKNRFLSLKQIKPEVLEILTRVFHGAGGLEAFQIKRADGEIGLKTHMGETYFAVINIGDVSKFIKKLQEGGGQRLTGKGR